MKNIPMLLICICGLFNIDVISVKVIDLAVSFNNFTCLKQQGYDHTIIRAYHSYGAIDIVAASNIKLSNQAGLSTDVYMFPCRGKDYQVQVNQLLQYLDNMMKFAQKSSYQYSVGNIWLDIETNPSPGCSWSAFTTLSNCQYVSALIRTIQTAGRSVGIYASGYMWNQIFGSKNQCSLFTQLPLWYAHYDGQANFNDWEMNKFGNWLIPTLKQYTGSQKVCDITVDQSFF